jgi:membrane-bound serine protease (ClpP class)
MCKLLYWTFFFLFSTTYLFPANAETKQDPIPKTKIVIIPIEGPIASPILYILKRGINEANENSADAIVLKVDTPGGELKTTLEMMELLDKFEGETVTFIDDEAISAGAYISIATQEIYFSPSGVMGAAAVIQGTGEDVPETAKLKIDSYLLAKVRTMTSNYPYRSQVVRAMMDESYELKIEEEILKEKGELLTLTAEEAFKNYGTEPKPLLSSGTRDSIEDLLTQKYGENGYEILNFEVTWSENLAKFMASISPILMGLGMLLLFVEFKTPGFGVFGIAGITLLAIVFAGKFTAGLAGHEEALLFALGCTLLIVEFFIIPGTYISGLLGFSIIIGTIGWSLVDRLPNETTPIQFGDFSESILFLSKSFLYSIVALLLFGRFIPKSVKNRLVLETINKTPEAVQQENSIISKIGIVVNALHPYGTIEIENQNYTAKTNFGSIDKGKKIKVIAMQGNEAIVEEI